MIDYFKIPDKNSEIRVRVGVRVGLVIGFYSSVNMTWYLLLSEGEHMINVRYTK